MFPGKSSSAELPSSGILCCSVNQAPRSMSRQRSLQNGRYDDVVDHSTGRRHVGHFTVVATDEIWQSGATCELKRHVALDVDRPAGGIHPAKESDGAAMLTTADLGK